MIDTAALHHGSGLAAVHHPVRMLPVLLLIAALAVIIARHLHNVRTLPGIFPGHIVGSYGDQGIFLRVVLPHRRHQPAGNLLPVLVRMGVINLVSDGPQKQTGVIPVPAHPAAHVPLTPFLKKPAVVILRLGALPHVEALA